MDQSDIIKQLVKVRDQLKKQIDCLQIELVAIVGSIYRLEQIDDLDNTVIIINGMPKSESTDVPEEGRITLSDMHNPDVKFSNPARDIKISPIDPQPSPESEATDSVHDDQPATVSVQSETVPPDNPSIKYPECSEGYRFNARELIRAILSINPPLLRVELAEVFIKYADLGKLDRGRGSVSPERQASNAITQELTADNIKRIDLAVGERRHSREKYKYTLASVEQVTRQFSDLEWPLSSRGLLEELLKKDGPLSREEIRQAFVYHNSKGVLRSMAKHPGAVGTVAESTVDRCLVAKAPWLEKSDAEPPDSGIRYGYVVPVMPVPIKPIGIIKPSNNEDVPVIQAPQTVQSIVTSQKATKQSAPSEYTIKYPDGDHTYKPRDMLMAVLSINPPLLREEIVEVFINLRGKLINVRSNLSLGRYVKNMVVRLANSGVLTKVELGNDEQVGKGTLYRYAINKNQIKKKPENVKTIKPTKTIKRVRPVEQVKYHGEINRPAEDSLVEPLHDLSSDSPHLRTEFKPGMSCRGCKESIDISAKRFYSRQPDTRGHYHSKCYMEVVKTYSPPIHEGQG